MIYYLMSVDDILQGHDLPGDHSIGIEGAIGLMGY